MKDYRQTIQWLYQNGSAVIRYRTATELTGENNPVYPVDRLEHDLLADPTMQACLECLLPNTSFNGIHSSKDTAFENAAGRLINLGCRAGMQPFDERMQPFRQWLADGANQDLENMGWDFNRSQVAAMLAMAGYRDEAVITEINNRLARIAAFTHLGDFDLYVDPADCPALPTAYRGRSLLDPRLYPHDYLRLPTIHDIHAFAYAPWIVENPVSHVQLESILEYIANPAYQRLKVGHSIILASNEHYYSLGWDVSLPGYWVFDRESNPDNEGMLVQRVELAAHFSWFHSHPWLGTALAHLENFRTIEGTYKFPRQYLKETSGYWVNGAHMGLGENRRTKNWLELESTFRMLKILRLVGSM